MIITSLLSIPVSTAWSGEAIFDLKQGSSWKTAKAGGGKLSAKKDSTSTEWSVKTISKTCISNPTFRFVNSDNQVRCTSRGVGNNDETVTGKGNTGTKGYTYYASVKGAINMVNDSSIKLKFNPK